MRSAVSRDVDGAANISLRSCTKAASLTRASLPGVSDTEEVTDATILLVMRIGKVAVDKTGQSQGLLWRTSY